MLVSLFSDLSEDPARHLRIAALTSSVIQFLMIDIGCHNSTVNNPDFLHIKTPPVDVRLVTSNRSPLIGSCREKPRLQLFHGKKNSIPGNMLGVANLTKPLCPNMYPRLND